MIYLFLLLKIPEDFWLEYKENPLGSNCQANFD